MQLQQRWPAEREGTKNRLRRQRTNDSGTGRQTGLAGLTAFAVCPLCQEQLSTSWQPLKAFKMAQV